jgi:hypothetical protein
MASDAHVGLEACVLAAAALAVVGVDGLGRAVSSECAEDESRQFWRSDLCRQRENIPVKDGKSEVLCRMGVACGRNCCATAEELRVPAGLP